MKKIVLILSGLLLSASALAADGVVDADNGKRVFEADPTKCISCHSNGEHFKDNAKTVADIDKWVRRCDIHFGTNWFEDDVLDVVAYLNRDYYKYPEDNAAKQDDASQQKNGETAEK